MAPFVSLFLTAAVALQPPRQSGQMVVFCTRSRHTYGFESAAASAAPIVQNKKALQDSAIFDLPLLEFQTVSSRDDRDSAILVDLTAVDDTSGNLFWAVPRITTKAKDADETFQARIASAASRCVFTHASFDVLLSVPPELTKETSLMASAAGCDLLSSNTEVVDMRNPNLSKNQRLDLLAEVGVIIAEPEKSATPSQPTVLLRRVDGHIHIGYRTAMGPAAGPGAPGIAPRRNYKGILGKFALKNRLDTSQHLTTTAMEPEIAFLMSNLGNTFSTDIHKVTVLDPCCGSCSHLLCAAAAGASTLVGVDQNSTAFLGADAEFQRHGLVQPSLMRGNVLEPELTSALSQSDTYHAILCDPPYGIGAPVLDDNEKQTRSSGADSNACSDTTLQKNDDLPSAKSIVAAVLKIARRTLVIGGRVVLFVPARGPKEVSISLSKMLSDRGCLPEEVLEEHDVAETSNKSASLPTTGSLRLIHGRRQRFSPTFSRWLVVMERVK